ncbi:hypothetical protein [Aneurinibacillus terranovensis]|nr:hypothetical protein [Aneurinibacillus terranovensis]
MEYEVYICLKCGEIQPLHQGEAFACLHCGYMRLEKADFYYNGEPDTLQ